MTHHKRRRPKNRRAGCLLCKPWKGNHAKGSRDSLRIQERKALEAYKHEIKDYYSEEIWRPLDLTNWSHDENWVINMENMYEGYEYDSRRVR